MFVGISLSAATDTIHFSLNISGICWCRCHHTTPLHRLRSHCCSVDFSIGAVIVVVVAGSYRLEFLISRWSRFLVSHLHCSRFFSFLFHFAMFRRSCSSYTCNVMRAIELPLILFVAVHLSTASEICFLTHKRCADIEWRTAAVASISPVP